MIDYIKNNRWGLAALVAVLLFVLFLKDVVGEPIAHAIMWGIAGWQLGGWANSFGKRMTNG